MISGCECIKCFLAQRFDALALVFTQALEAVVLNLVPFLRCGRWHHRTKPSNQHWFVSAVPAHARCRGDHTVLCSPGYEVSHRDPPWPKETLKNQRCHQEGPRATSCKPELDLLQPGFKHAHGVWLGTLSLIIIMRPSKTGILITREFKHSQVLNTWE